MLSVQAYIFHITSFRFHIFLNELKKKKKIRKNPTIYNLKLSINWKSCKTYFNSIARCVKSLMKSRRRSPVEAKRSQRQLIRMSNKGVVERMLVSATWLRRNWYQLNPEWARGWPVCTLCAWEDRAECILRL